MIEQPHYPSKWTVTLVFLVLLLMIAGIFAWAFIFNKGTLVVRSDQAFQFEVNGQVNSCEEGLCRLSLTPAVYDFVATSPGYQELSDTVIVERWRETPLDLRFELIPTLRDLSASDIPPSRSQHVDLRPVAGEFELYDLETDESIVRFETLVDPELIEGAWYSFIRDSGRLFFVDHRQQRRRRLFDDSVELLDVILSQSGRRALVFIEQRGVEQTWMWFSAQQNLALLDYPLQAGMLKWKGDSDYQLYVVSQDLSADVDVGILDQVMNSVDTTHPSATLFELNVDQGSTKELLTFPELPQQFVRRGDRYFLEFAEDEWSELIVSMEGDFAPPDEDSVSFLSPLSLEFTLDPHST